MLSFDNNTNLLDLSLNKLKSQVYGLEFSNQQANLQSSRLAKNNIPYIDVIFRSELVEGIQVGLGN